MIHVYCLSVFLNIGTFCDIHFDEVGTVCLFTKSVFSALQWILKRYGDNVKRTFGS